MFILRSLVLSFAALLLCGFAIIPVQASGEAVARDWSRYPAVLRLTTGEDIYAVGDVHGDYERLADLLAINHLIAAAPPEPDRVQWTAGHAVVVCTGDLIDRWTNGIAVIRFFRALQREARAAGGDVV